MERSFLDKFQHPVIEAQIETKVCTHTAFTMIKLKGQKKESGNIFRHFNCDLVTSVNWIVLTPINSNNNECFIMEFKFMYFTAKVANFNIFAELIQFSSLFKFALFTREKKLFSFITFSTFSSKNNKFFVIFLLEIKSV